MPASAKARAACTEDIGSHLDFLRATLETGDISPFVGYLGWLVQVLGTRSVPHRSVIHSLDYLAAFFQGWLGDQSIPINAALQAGKDALSNSMAAPDFDSPCPARWEEADPYSAAALSGKRREAVSLLDRALARRNSVPLVAVHVIQPAMYNVGRQWQQNTASVAQEHLATALSQSWMAQSMGQARGVPANGLRALFGCVAENRHVLGLRMVADAFELGGWTTYNLGADSTPEAVVEQINIIRPHLVGFSASLPQHLRALRLMVGSLRTILRAACPRIVVGGLVLNQFPHLAGWVGAELLGVDAVSAAAAVAPSPP